MSMPIRDYLDNDSDYKVDPTYQREPDVWSLEDKQCLIDTIIREEPMPLFFFNYKNDEKKYYIVDGQQRLNAIKKFRENNISLNKKFSGAENHDKKYDELSEKQRKNFLKYELRIYIFDNLSDLEVRRIFSKLQRGERLNLGERLNALPGKIVDRMRELTEFPFLKNSVGIQRKRYGLYPVSARILFYEKNLIKDSNEKALFSFFGNYADLEESDKDFQNCRKTLNILENFFPKSPGNYQYLKRHAWIISVYAMIRELSKEYTLKGQSENIREFIEDFHGRVYDKKWRRTKAIYIDFFDNVRGGFSEKNNRVRRDILKEEFISIYNPPKLSEQRQISDEDKLKCYHRANKKCEECSMSFKDFKEPEYHHKVKYVEGGPTDPKNIEVLCSKCHGLRHKSKK